MTIGRTSDEQKPAPANAAGAGRADAGRLGPLRRPGRRARYEELVAEQYTRGQALSTAAAFEIDDVIDPADTRAVLTDVLARVS